MDSAAQLYTENLTEESAVSDPPIPVLPDTVKLVPIVAEVVVVREVVVVNDPGVMIDAGSVRVIAPVD